MDKFTFLPFLFLLLLVTILGSFSLIASAGPSQWSPVEKIFLEESGRQSTYPGELLPAIETENAFALGKLTALNFLHWILENPEGVVALPTGKTPEFFIKFLKHYKTHWQEQDIQQQLKSHGIHSDSFPDTSQLKFVQLDEFYPMDPTQQNSFTRYVYDHYLPLLDLQSHNILTIDIASRGILKELGMEKVFPDGKVDLSLLERSPDNEQESWQKQALEEVEEFCQQYEAKIRSWGGIVFFLGGIGAVDGHIAFNMPGSSHDSTTRLVQLNYPIAAQSATDLGGIEFSRDKTAITIGLGTITFNKNATLIIAASGEAKAKAVANAIEIPQHPDYPTTALQGLPGAKFYLTRGASSHLEARKTEDFQKARREELTEDLIEEVIITIALEEKKTLDGLTERNLVKHRRGAALYEKFPYEWLGLIQKTKERIIAKIENGCSLAQNETILHTEPHHDDVMLSYYPLLERLLQQNQNYFVCLTSGFNSVTNPYMLKTLNGISEAGLEKYSSAIFGETYDSLIHQHLEAAEKHDTKATDLAESLILLRNLREIYAISDIETLKQKWRWVKEEYFPHCHPGEKDIPEIQTLKGAMRESEEDRMLALLKVPPSHSFHMRAKFYTGDYFTPCPTIEGDALPLLELYNKINPSIITVALDPEGTGPDTHYKVLQVVAQALRMASSNLSPTVWGYRNVWHRFKISEATILVPVSEEELEKLDNAFLTCYSTQKNASFPCPEYDGPFSEFALKVQREQYEQLKTLLGEEFFLQHPDKRMREAKGFLFIKGMSKEGFFQQAQELKNKIEFR